MKPLSILIIQLCGLLIHCSCYSANAPVSEALLLDSWTKDASSQVLQSDLIVLGKIGTSESTNADSSWTTITSSISVIKTLKGSAPKQLRFQAVRMDPSRSWELDSMWAVECGVSIKGEENRTAFQAMQNLPSLNMGQNAIVFLRKIDGRWCLLATYLERDAERFQEVTKVVSAKKTTSDREIAPVTFNIALPERMFLNHGSIPVRCTITNRGQQFVIMDPLGFPSHMPEGLLPILTSRKSMLQEITEEGRKALLPVRAKSNRDGIVIPPKSEVSVWIDLRDYFSISEGAWKLTMCLNINYDVRRKHFGIEPETVRSTAIRSASISFTVSNR